jgi:HTH-type transcriptional regulator / antitoxin HigA
MPALAEPTYPNLLASTSPEVITTRAQYESALAQLGALVRKGSRRVPGETKLMRLLAVLVEDFDRRQTAPAGRTTPQERLRYLLESSGKTSADLSPIFGSRSHISEALNGRRPISADHARKLGELFAVKPGLFI